MFEFCFVALSLQPLIVQLKTVCLILIWRYPWLMKESYPSFLCFLRSATCGFLTTEVLKHRAMAFLASFLNCELKQQ